MKKAVLLSLLFAQHAIAQSYQKVHNKAIVVDTHNDILMKVVDLGIVFDHDQRGKTHTDLARWKQGGLDVQVFSVYCDGDAKNAYAYANRSIDSLDAVVLRNPQKIAKAYSYKDVLNIVQQHKIAALIGVEGGHMIEDDLDKLDSLYSRGVRYLTLTHNIAPAWVTSAADETSGKPLPHKGLNEFGRQVVQRMNALGMLIDVSHAGEQTFWDVIALSAKPIIASHSSVYTLTPHRRNLKDDQIKAIAKNGGVIQVNFNPGFIDSSFDRKEAAFALRHKAEFDSLMYTGLSANYALDIIYANYSAEAEPIRPTLSHLIDHIDYIIRLVGVDHVGLGSDFDGINVTPYPLNDVTTYPLITQALLSKGYSKKDVEKILGGNFLRVLQANETSK
ncbi:MAG TPA: dipeptidase [Phnomibacter sp.]|nr:dipeptidase [Phnomibacter sp.]